LSEIIAPKPVSGSEWIYLQRQFFIYENQGCDKCIRNTKPPYLPPLRGVHVSYDPKTSNYLFGFYVRSRLVALAALFQARFMFQSSTLVRWHHYRFELIEA